MLPPSGKWSVQPPPWAALDFDNPILKDVQHVASGAAAFLNRGRYNDSFRTSATPPIPTRQPSGISYRLTGSAAYLATDAGGWVNARSNWTVFVLGVPRSLAANSAISIIAESPGGTRDRGIQFNTSGKVIATVQDSTVKNLIGSTTIAVNTPFSAASRASTTALNVFVNGVVDATPLTITNNGLNNYVSPEVVVGYGGVGSGFSTLQGSAFDLSLLVWWSRALTDAEILSLHQNPWQVFKTPRRIIVPESTAVTAYVLDTTPGTYNLTGSDATVLFDRVTSVTSGTYSITGSSPAMLFDSLVSVTPGAYSIAGVDAAALFDQMVEVTPGAYSITGTDPVLLYDRVVITSIGQYNISPSAVTMVRVGINWPDPADVRLGVQYGPTGVEYTGTMLSGQIWLRRR